MKFLTIACVFAASSAAGLLSTTASAVHSRPQHLVNRHHFAPSSVNTNAAPNAAPYSMADCKEHYYTQRLDHFDYSSGDRTFQQRFVVCKKDEWWKGNGSPIFFYTGNEANVELYVNLTGFMWENAQSFGAALVFAEHRYFGKSLPFPNEPMPLGDKLKYLSVDQAMMDYATIIDFLKTEWNANNSPFLGFGGSYGGMLCAWTRAKYPSSLDGCVAGSAPVIDFVDMEPALDFRFFAQTETFDASAAGGAESDLCKQNIHTVIMDMYNSYTNADHANPMNFIAQSAGVCNPNQQQANGLTMLYAFVNAIGMMTMGSYPYPSSYMMMGGKGDLPPYPMRQGCGYLSKNFGNTPSTKITQKAELYNAFGQAMRVFYEANGAIPCINVTTDVNIASQIVDYLWGYLACTSVVMPSSMTGDINDAKNGDMFYPAPFSVDETIQGCHQSYGKSVTPNMDWVKISFGGRKLIETTTNTFFTNGELDPWRFGGFNEGDPNQHNFNPKNKVALVKNAGHHMELMFKNANDTLTNVVDVRNEILSEMKRWIAEKKSSSVAETPSDGESNKKQQKKEENGGVRLF